MLKWIDFTWIAVAAFLYHPEKWFLFGMRTENCRDEPHVWENRWGGVDFGETIQEAMIRELEEESGRLFDPTQIHSLGYREQVREHGGQQTHRIVFYHLIILTGDEDIRNMEQDKRAGMEFFPADALPSREDCLTILYPTLSDFRESIEQLIGTKLSLG